MIYPTEVQYLHDYELLITFSNGEKGFMMGMKI